MVTGKDCPVNGEKLEIQHRNPCLLDAGEIAVHKENNVEEST
jgi:hypothetical protein